MKTILFFDTETSGKPKKYSAPVTDVENWPRLVQLGWITTYENGVPTGSGEAIIKPDGWIIPEEAAAVHGISQEMALAQGKPVEGVLMHFAFVVKNSDLIVGHNIEFDMNVMGAEFVRFMGSNPLEGIETICTMKSSTDFCKLPKTTSRGTDKYKWPRLSELYFKLFGHEMGAAHTALQDIKNASSCYFELKSLGIIE